MHPHMTPVMTQRRLGGGPLPWGHFALLESLKRFLTKRAPERYSRRWPRIAVEQPAQLKLPNGTQREVTVKQLSVGGARIQSAVPLRAGDDIELEMGPDAGGRQSIAARIVYTLRENSGYFFACGLCFLGLRPEETQWIASFIAAEQARRRATPARGPQI
jgi:hypothetical protein